MKFLGFLKKEQKEEKPAERRVKIRAADTFEWFESAFRVGLDSARSEANNKYNTISKSFRGIQNSAKSMEKLRFPENDKVYTIANMLKDGFVTKVKNSTLPELTGTDYTALFRFYSDTLSIVNGFLNMSPKQVFFLSKYFPKESSKVITGIKQAKAELSGFRKFLAEGAKTLKMEEELKRLDAKQKELAGCIKAADEEKTVLRKRAKSAESEIKRIESSVKALLDSKEWKGFEELRDSAEKIQGEMEGLSNTLRNELEGVKRPLKKIAHDTRKPVVRPFEAVMEGREKSLIDALKESASLPLKPKEREKVERLVQRLESDIPILVKHHNELLKRKNDTGRAIERFPGKDRKKQLEESLARKRSELESIKRKITEKTKSRKHTENQLQELKEAMGRTVAENTGGEFRISWLE